MAAIRKETLDIIYDELINPSTFLKRMLDCSKTGMVSLNIVQQMSKELCKLPLDYLVHCLTKDKDRFAYDPVEKKVCLQSQLKTQLTKTTPYGTIDPEQDQDAKYTKVFPEYPEYKTPFFRPMFSITHKVFPIFFDDDGFFVDDLPEKQVDAEKPMIDAPEHDLYSVEPLTNNERPKVILHSCLSECFNCGAKDHKFSECSEPTNIQRINRKKRELKRNPGRLYQELESQSKRETFIPGKLSPTLKSALGLSEGQEPPYYYNMRIYGYPPGYVLDADPSEPTPTFQSVYQPPLYLETEELKIYDDSYVERDQEDKQEEFKERVKVRLIDYGIDSSVGVDTNKLETALQQYQCNTEGYYYGGNSNQMNNSNGYQYPTEYAYQNSADYNAYYYSGYYDYSGYEQYNTLSATSEYVSESSGTVLSSPPPPPPPPPSLSFTEPILAVPTSSSCLPSSSQINKDVSNNQTLTSVDTQSQPNTHQVQVPSYNDDNDSVDMDISDEDDM